jgi:HK97 family phage major capsid protein
VKKVQLKINRATKQIVLMLAFAGAIGYSAFSDAPANVRVAVAPFMGFVAAFKKKGVELSEDEEKQFKAMDEVLMKGFEGVVTDTVLTEKLNALKSELSPESIKKLGEQADEINETLKAQAAAIDQLKTMGSTPQGGKVKSLKQQIKDALGTENAQKALGRIKNLEVGAMGGEFEVKAATDMTMSGTTAYTTAGTNIAIAQPEFIPGLNDVARNQPFIMQILNVMPTSSENIVYVEKYNPQGSADWVGEGDASPEVSFDIVISNSRAKTVTAHIKISTEMLEDLDYIAAAIQKELIYQAAIEVDTFLLQGNGSGDNLKGIKAFAPAYTLTSSQLSTTNPNNCDAILAAATQIVSKNFTPDIAVLNPIDFAQTKLLKGNTGYYIVNPNNNDSTWAGIRVVQSNQVPIGYTMVMDSSKTNVQPYKDATISYGWVDDDFIKRLVTVQIRQRLHSYIKTNDVDAFVYDELANIKTALTQV